MKANSDKVVELYKLYESLSYTDNYIIGYNFNGKIYFTICKSSDIFPAVSYENYAGGTIKFKPNNKDRLKFYKLNHNELCNAEHFEQHYADEYNGKSYNRGEYFERLITELFNQVWYKDNLKFTKSGDVIVNGVHYQIKYEKATFSTMNTMKGLA